MSELNMSRDLNYSVHLFAQVIPIVAKKKGIKHVVLSPGSRNVPLIIGFTEDPYFECHSVIDERSAGFFALGIAKKIGQPVVLVCTSGSALLNYYSAIVEASHSDIPLLICSADRPRYLVDIQEDQTIYQLGVFQGYVEASVSLTEPNFRNNASYTQWVVNRCFERRGPVHINVPFDEPLYGMVKETNLKVENISPSSMKDSLGDFSDFITVWKQASKKLIIAGSNFLESLSEELVDRVVKDPSVVFLAENLSNLSHRNLFNHTDLLLEALSLGDKKEFHPDIVLTFGGKIVSKRIKTYLREYKPQHHFHVDVKSASDMFFAKVKHIRSRPQPFFKMLSESKSEIISGYAQRFELIFENAKLRRDDYLRSCEFSDLTVYDEVFKTIPENFEVHFSNSAPIRYAQLFQLKNRSYCNRGVSGIDGCTSTAIGFQKVSKEPVLLITGDLSFLYDINGLWVDGIDKNFRIIVVNNQGGGIFKIITDKRPTHFKSFIETKHDRNTAHLAGHFGFDYDAVDDLKGLKAVLQEFYKPTQKPRILEIKTPNDLNDKVLKGLFNFLKTGEV